MDDGQVEAKSSALVDLMKDDVVAKLMDTDDNVVIAVAMGVVQEVTRESATRRHALCML
jgi:hypothetical protein